METVTRPAVKAPPPKAPPRHFLDLDRLSAVELRRILDQAMQWKQSGDRSKPLAGKILAMMFEKPKCCRAMSMRR